MKFLSVMILLFYASFSFAGEKNWEEKKAKKLSNIDQRIVSLQEMKTCVQNAEDKAALKACKDKHKAAMKSFGT